jgi:hypothetical protein
LPSEASAVLFGWAASRVRRVSSILDRGVSAHDLDKKYPGIIDECRRAMALVLPDKVDKIDRPRVS